jgi:hypothetical protein
MRFFWGNDDARSIATSVAATRRARQRRDVPLPGNWKYSEGRGRYTTYRETDKPPPRGGENGRGMRRRAPVRRRGAARSAPVSA